METRQLAVGLLGALLAFCGFACSDDARSTEGWPFEGVDAGAADVDSGLPDADATDTARVRDGGCEVGGEACPPTPDTCGEDGSCGCEPGTERSCYTGPESTRGRGVCAAGRQVCGPQGTWGACEGETTPTEESCDGVDDDCDGTTDELCPCNYKSIERGVCAYQETTEDGSCARPENYEEVEASVDDGLDNDCDGETDETQVARVATGGDFSCAVVQNGNVRCWGDVSDPPAAQFDQIDAGSTHVCGTTTGGEIRCWGDPSNLPPGWSGSAYRQVTADLHTCVLENSGDVDCWSRGGRAKAKPPSTSFRSISAGGTLTCGVTSAARVECWGRNRYGQTDAPDGSFVQVSAGNTHVCGVAASGSVECWGSDQYGRANPPSGTFQQVSAGTWHTCGVTTAGDVECWGRDSEGQATPPSGTFTQVSSSFEHTCGRTASGDVECWGRDDDGEASPPSF